MALFTYLSEYVHHILVEHSKTNKSTKRFLLKELVYDWKEISNALGLTTDDFNILEQSAEWYREKVQLVWEVVHEAGLAMLDMDESVSVALDQLCHWVDCQTNVFLCNSHKYTEEPLLAVLVLTAALERALGNVYLSKSSPVPFLLRDLLKTPELTGVFGKVPIVFTQLLLGCPRGLNLRNVAWHGFFSEGELHPHLVSGLVILIASLGKILLDYEIVPKRPFVSTFQTELVNVFPDISSRLEEIEGMLKMSRFIPDRGKTFWRKALSLLQSERYGYSLVLLMPQLEHCLRVLYCRVNDCPARLLTAESTTLYTTLDEILAPAQKPVVSSGLLMLLLDVTSSLSGPRLRDRLSHGEINLESVPKWLVNLLFCVALATSHSNCGDAFADQSDIYQGCNIPLCSQLQQITSNYHSRFHIMASLCRQLTCLLDHWQGWQNWSLPADVVVQPVPCQSILALDQLVFSHSEDIHKKLQNLRDCLKDSHLPTLYRPKPELGLAMTLSDIVSCVRQTAQQVCHAAELYHQMWSDRLLRSRSRATALRMWTVLPDIWTALLCIVKVVTLCYLQLPHLATLGNTVFRFFKAMRKAVENTVTYCNSDKNRWMEAHKILSDLSSKCLEFLTMNSDFVNKD